MTLTQQARRLVIDTDPGLDDALALWLAVASPELDVEAVLTTGGNAGLALTTANALSILSLAACGAPVHAGADRPLAGPRLEGSRAHGADGIGGIRLPPSRASAAATGARPALHDRLRDLRGGLTLLGLGPVTNLALSLAVAPGLAGGIAEIVLMSGAAGSGGIVAPVEFNAGTDPEALAILLAAGPTLTFATLDLTAQATLGEADIEAFAARSDGACLQAAASMLRAIPARDTGGRPVHDACAVAFLVRPDLFTARAVHARVVLDGDARGQTAFEPPADGRPANARLLETIDRAGFVALLGERIASLP